MPNVGSGFRLRRKGFRSGRPDHSFRSPDFEEKGRVCVALGDYAVHLCFNCCTQRTLPRLLAPNFFLKQPLHVAEFAKAVGTEICFRDVYRCFLITRIRVDDSVFPFLFPDPVEIPAFRLKRFATA
jgi:hypothetical protein